MINKGRRILLQHSGIYADSYRIIDSIPSPVYRYCRIRHNRVEVFAEEANFGVCESKEEKHYGFKLHPGSVPIDFTIASASHYDIKFLWNLACYHQNLVLKGDKGYIDQSLQEKLYYAYDPEEKNQKVQNPNGLDCLIRKARRMIKTIGGQSTDLILLEIWQRVCGGL